VREARGARRGQDVVLHGWASGDTQPIEGARNIMFMRRYELFDGGIGRVDWKRLTLLICVNSWIQCRTRRSLPSRRASRRRFR
jgi:hypothetical protein